MKASVLSVNSIIIISNILFPSSTFMFDAKFAAIWVAIISKPDTVSSLLDSLDLLAIKAWVTIDS